MHPVNFFGAFMTALIDQRATRESIAALKRLGFNIITMPPSHFLQTGVASHTDMLIFIGFGRLFCHASYYEENKALIDDIARIGNLNISLSDEDWGQDYPKDVLFNACLVGKKLICNEKTVSTSILFAAQKSECEIINVPQGYTKCSICVVSDNAIITADKPIADICLKIGMDVLLISEGHISLPPYSFGFIGGTSGLYKNDLYFCGSLEAHPDAEKIKEFCKKHGKTAFPLTNCELQDVGSIFFIGE